MSVVSCIELFKGRNSGGEIKAKGVYFFVETKETRVFYVLCSSILDGTYAAVRATGIPALGSAYSIPGGVTDTTLVCANIHAEPIDDSHLAFHVYCEYSDNVKAPVSPLSMPCILSGGSHGRRCPVYQDINGAPICNSAGEVFDPPMTDEFFDSEMNIEQNLSTIDVSFWNSYCGSDTSPAAINSDAFTTRLGTFAIGQAKFGGYTYETKHTYGLTYYTIHVRILGRATGWNRIVADRGYTQLDSSGNAVPILSKSAPYKALNSPQFLNGSGKVLTPQPTPGGSTVVVPLTFEINNQMAFSTMPFIW